MKEQFAKKLNNLTNHKEMQPEDKIRALEDKVEREKKLNKITNMIHAAKNINEIIIDLKDDILSLFDVDRITIYAVDGAKKQIFSRVKAGDEVNEIRVPISPNSIAGYTALSQKIVNISDVYDNEELKKISPKISFDSSWDKKTGYKTTQVLAAPIIFNKFLLGVIQVINKKSGQNFTKDDEIPIQEIARILGIAFYNQLRVLQSKKPSKFDYLVSEGKITQKELEAAITDARARKESVENILMRNFKISKGDLGKSWEQYFGCKFVQYNDRAVIPGELVTLLEKNVNFLKKNFWVPLSKKDGKVVIILDDPNNIQKTDLIRQMIQAKDFEFCIAFKEDILSYINLFFGGGGVHTPGSADDDISDILGKLGEEEDDTSENVDISVSEHDSAIVQLVNKTIIDAYNRGASDIHIEPYMGKKNTEVRFRIDGSCQIYQTIPASHKAAIVSRLKIMSDLDIAERRLPQDGKIKFKKYGGLDIELRVATIPTAGGVEDVVMRILASSDPIPLDKMGMTEKNYKNFIDCIIKPYGLVLVVGPTGSGKTTTLHSALGYINKPERKIWTAEDPVEITQYGLRQVNVHAKIGLTFAAAMRSFLRADPDVVMVGEMRDEETASTGIEASLSGHLVFSTLHTNSAPETVIRLLDMGLDPFNFADALLCVLA
ncbi:MAG: ATPase, T2SS/T4P/T4SS family, partial [Thermodesulfobacteriota bacterium]|nr:ATPase, T2SS/T4P/T4SS family [Thermodesulfobacteriota bacterium]